MKYPKCPSCGQIMMPEFKDSGVVYASEKQLFEEGLLDFYCEHCDIRFAEGEEE